MKIFDVNNKNFERLTFQEINFEFRSSNHWRRLNLNYIFLCVRSRVYNEHLKNPHRKVVSICERVEDKNIAKKHRVYKSEEERFVMVWCVDDET